MSQIISLYKTRVGSNPIALQLLKQFKPDYPDLQLIGIEDVLRFEYDDGASPDIERLKRLFCYPGAESMTTQTKYDEAEVIEIS
ncbi:MAG: hypothetical protein HYV53_02435 [Parcubacteria group bacterium]|nr:hypothetical protein [Parcubacteria group bacterium]